LREQVIEGLYGDGVDGKRDGVTAARCIKFIEHAKQYANQVITGSPALLRGTVDKLTVPLNAQPLVITVNDEEDEEDIVGIEQEQ